MKNDKLQQDLMLKERIEKLINEVGYIVPLKDLCNDKRFPSQKGINNCYRRLFGETYFKHYLSLGYKEKEVPKPEIESYEYIVAMIKGFTDKNNRFPSHKEFTKENNLYYYGKVNKILKHHDKSLNDVATELGYSRITRNEGYEYWIEKLREVVKETGVLKYRDFQNYDLPTATWYIDNCPNQEVKSFNDLLEKELHIRVNSKMSKETATKIILEMANKYDRPLMYDDFRGTSKDRVSMSTINKYWGTMNKMKLELGLEIVQEDMISKSKSKEEMLDDMQKLINELGRLPLSKEIDACKYTNNSASYHRYFGGINNVFVQLGYIPNKKSISLSMSNEDIINTYKEFIEETGVTPSHAYAKDIYHLPSPTTVIRRFNCKWNEFITMLGYEPNDVTYNKTYAKDGTYCSSTGEAIIHNYLLSLNIDNLEKETYYRDVLDNQELQEKAGLKRLDWTFEYNNETYYVEYFGMMGFKQYDKRHEFKIDLITKDGKINNFIALYPEDLSELDKLIKEKISYKEVC